MPWGPAAPVFNSATAEDGAIGADGTVAVRTGNGRMTVAVVDAAGQVVSPVEGAVPAGTEAEAAATAPDGSSLVATTNGDDVLTAYVRAPGGPLRPVASGATPVAFGTGVSDAAVVGLTPGTFAIAWLETTDAGASTVRTATVAGGRLVANSTYTLLNAGSDVSVDELTLAAAGGEAVAGWIVSNSESGATAAQVRAASRFAAAVPPVTLNSSGPADYLDLVGSSSSVLATWGGTFGARTTGGGTVVTPAGTALCTIPQDLASGVGIAGPGGYRMIGTAGSLLTDVATSGCASGDRVVGPAVGDDANVSATADAEGSAVAAVALPNGPRRVLVQDATPPAVRDVSVPTDVAEGASFDVSSDVADAWGVASTTWSVDGAAQASSAHATLGPLPVGRHTVRFEAIDQAGNKTLTDPMTVDVRAADTPPPGTDPVSPPVSVAVPPPAVPAPPAAPTPPAGLPTTEPVSPPPPAPRAARPRVLSAKLVERDGGWRVELVLRGATRAKIEVFRERSMPGRKLRRAPVCGAPRNRHAPGGRQGGRQVRVGTQRLSVAMPAGVVRALRRRGRYALVVHAYAADGRGSSAFVQRKTVC